MNIEWVMGLFGGLQIGLGGAVYLLGNGRIMGASGILGGLVDGSARDTMAEKLAFVAGLIGTPFLLRPLIAPEVQTHLTSNLILVVIAGLLVGVGTRIANGCTSGHGVCGISRFSLRGIVATVFYILAGGVTLVFLRHLWGLI
ncbi:MULTISPECIES: YeeE/YedE family protein [unclassified Ruegeria]|uniref:YeeE/YedE family protein n=1 Tax=unclassified Ruegeria TaxID=2625375 RepID=UPI001491559E|nr:MULTISPECIES: YeeE/YedE thiosulfate transporter family protein [unclassified Ruegeria]NOD89467.1 YeeE/YedE family protein [Ruegeria sp. HKCCD4318]NOE13790.1 YeeE/YedE family protein [Ruegeria sp. HKCCD4318-2]NOG08275.1 YeeE/YedE family protein [Ruegeria sp. HKCCD4315]